VAQQLRDSINKCDNQNIQGDQKTKLPKKQWPNEEIGKWIQKSF
jgi:hypothetical protein